MDEWQKRHEQEHQLLEVRLASEARKEAADAVKGALAIVNKIANEVADIKKESGTQSETLKILRTHARRQSKERRARVAADREARKTKEENRKLWEWRWKMFGRAFFGFGGAATVLELLRMWFASKGH